MSWKKYDPDIKDVVLWPMGMYKDIQFVTSTSHAAQPIKRLFPTAIALGASFFIFGSPLDKSAMDMAIQYLATGGFYYVSGILLGDNLMIPMHHAKTSTHQGPMY